MRQAPLFLFDTDEYVIPAGESIEISDVSSELHLWGAVWQQNLLGIPSEDTGEIDVQDDMTIRITPSGVKM